MTDFHATSTGIILSADHFAQMKYRAQALRRFRNATSLAPVTLTPPMPPRDPSGGCAAMVTP